MVLALCMLLFMLGLLYGESFIVMLTTVVAVAVSAIPEGLVVSLTVILAIGMQRVMKRNALVRRMIAAETLGSISTICVDKTGTITPWNNVRRQERPHGYESSYARRGSCQ